jgi:hypothetical protein
MLFNLINKDRLYYEYQTLIEKIFCICCCFCPPDEDEIQEEMERIILVANRKFKDQNQENSRGCSIL